MVAGRFLPEIYQESLRQELGGISQRNTLFQFLTNGPHGLDEVSKRSVWDMVQKALQKVVGELFSDQPTSSTLCTPPTIDQPPPY